MNKALRLFLALFLIIQAFSTIVSSAFANRLSMSNRNIRATWERLNFKDAGHIVDVSCDVTIEGSFHTSTITKTRGALIGYITRAPQPQNCEGGEATILQASLPWHIRYDSFTGALPGFTGVRIQLVLASFNFNMGFTCLYRSTSGAPLFAIMNAISPVLTADSLVSIPRAEGSVFCPTSQYPEGVAVLSLLGTIFSIFFRLI